MSLFNTPSSILCITGTGTDVGKTVVTAGLLRMFTARGVETRAIKAVQTGCTDSPRACSPDAALYRTACPGADTFSLADFVPPCSPHLAAEMQGQHLDAGELASRIRLAASAPGLTLVEGAGGLLVPLNRRECFIDLFARLEAPLVLVAANVVGAINHVLLSLECLRTRGLEPLRIILADTLPDSAENGLLARVRRDNAETIASLGNTPDPLCLPHAPGIRSPVPAERERAWAAVAEHLAPIGDHPPLL